jgi:L-ribulose-5-phosphate 3-epimerase
MNRPKIGVRLESLAMPLRKAVEAATRMGADGVQVDAVGDLDPRRLSETGRRDFRHLLKSHNLELCALGCPLQRGLDVPEGQQDRIDRLMLTLSLSFELGPRIVVVEAGQIPDSDKDPRHACLAESLLVLGQHGDRVGAVLALETGLESGASLAQFLHRFDTGGLRVNFDPANLVMHGFNPEAAVKELRDKIVHVHAKDARSAGANRGCQEVALGHGDIDWLGLLGALEEIPYRGYLTIEREGGTDRASDVAGGVKFMRRIAP